MTQVGGVRHSDPKKTVSVRLSGYVVELPGTSSHDSDDDEDEGDDDDNWLDYSDMKAALSQGNFVKMTKRPRYCRVVSCPVVTSPVTGSLMRLYKIHAHSSNVVHLCDALVSDAVRLFVLSIVDAWGKKHNAYGRFTLTDPWWELTLTLDQRRQVCGATQYALRTDHTDMRKQKLVPMLLNKAYGQKMKDTHAIMTAVEQFLQSYADCDGFEYLDSAMQHFARNTENEEFKMQTELILKSDVVQCVVRAQLYPALLHFLCRLFPLKFVSVLVTPMTSVLPALQAAAEQEPWMFGFSVVLAKRFKVYGLEAPLKSLRSSGVLEVVTPTQRDALLIYEVLKLDAARDGHIFLSFPDLRNHRHWVAVGASVNDWAPALAFLVAQGVTKEERFDCKRNIFLAHNWKAEVDIANGMRRVMERGLALTQPLWRVDFTSPALHRLRGDPDQWRAVQRVASSPVTVLSGKGGCGKTTLVTQLLRDVCSRDSNSPPDTKTGVNLPGLSTDTGAERDQASGEVVQTPTDVSSSLEDEGASAELSPPASSLSVDEMVGTVTDWLAAERAKRHPSDAAETKAQRTRAELLTDIVRHLAAAPDTLLSRTPVGRTVLLTAPTGKAAKLLGVKAGMEAATLHAVIFSYRAFAKAQWVKKMEERKERERYHRKKQPEKGGSRTGEGSRKGKGSRTGKGSRAGERSRAGAEESKTGTGQGSGTAEESREGGGGAWRQGEEGGQRNKKDWEDGGAGHEQGGNDGGDAEQTDGGDGDDEAVWRYAGTRVLVVDECSLVSVRLFAALLTVLLDHSALCWLVLLGDVRQLPSVDPGQFLVSVFDSLGARGLSYELRTNHRSESHLIVSNASRIAQRQMPLFDPARHFTFCALDDSPDSGDPERDYAVRQLLDRQPELKDQQTSQLVAFRRVDCEAINELCCRHYNGHSTRSGGGGTDRGGKQRLDFVIGDKVCFKKNAMVLNQGTQLLPYLKPFPQILAALGVPRVTRGEGGKKGGGEGGMDVTAALDLITGEQQDPLPGDQSRSGRDPLPGDQSQSGRDPFPGDQSRSGQYPLPGDQSRSASRDGVRGDNGLSNADNGAGGSEREGDERDQEGDGRGQGGDGRDQEGDRRDQEGDGRDQEEDGRGQGGDKEEEDRKDKLKDGEIRLCNGEVFFIMDDVLLPATEGGREQRLVILSDRDPQLPRVACVSVPTLLRECRMRHSWARTIHTYQGSESDTVVYYLGGGMQNWKHVYTAITRGRRSVYICGRDSTLRQAVAQWDRPRRTRLDRRLTDSMKLVKWERLHAMVAQMQEQATQALDNAPTLTLPSPSPTPTPSFTPTPQASARPHPPSVYAEPDVSKVSLLDAFPDSDDSWLNDMSPVLDAKPALKQTVSETHDDSSDDIWLSMSPVLEARDNGWCETDSERKQRADSYFTAYATTTTTPVTRPTTPTTPTQQCHGEGEGDTNWKKPTPTKRQFSTETDDVTPKKSRSEDSVDSSVSPVRRSLKSLKFLE